MKKVLIITYYWPPSGGIGVLRCLKIAKYLRDYGWEPIIYTAKDPHYPSIDHSNDRDLVPDTTVLKKKIWEPYNLYKLFTAQSSDANVNNIFYVQEQDQSQNWKHKLSVWIRSNFFIPDARAMWIKPSVAFLLDYLTKNPVDAIYSIGPPHTNSRIATLVKKTTGIPWLADFQDPWTQVDYYKLLNLTKFGDRKHRRYEQEVFQHADKITIVSPTWKRDLESIGAKNVSVIPWGYDPDDYQNIVRREDTKFAVAHIGIMGHDRNPEVLIDVLTKLCKEVPGFSNDFEFRLVGQVDNTIQRTIEVKGLSQNVNYIGSIPRLQALELTINSPVLLLLLNQQSNTQGRIPGKFFEYLAARRPIISLGPINSDVSKILEETKAGSSFTYDDSHGLYSHLKHLYLQFLDNPALDSSMSKIESYSIKTLTGKIADYLNGIAKSK